MFYWQEDLFLQHSQPEVKIKQEHSNQVWFPLFMTLLLGPPTGVMGIFRAVRGCYTLGYEWKLGTQDFMFLYIHCCFKRSFVGRLTFYFPSFRIVLLHNVLKYRREIKRKRYAILKLDYFLLLKCSMFFIIMSYNYYDDFN